MPTNLVIGSDGFIGTPFCRFLEGKGEKVIRFDVKRGKKEDARFAKLPLANVDKVYFLAWDVGGSKYLYVPKLQKNQLDWNLALMRNVFDQLEKAKTPFVFISSQLTEETDTVYGATKNLGEVWSALLGGVSVRVWNAYGYMEEKNIKSHVISDFIYQALETKKISLMTTGEEWRQFTHIDDLSRAFWMAAHSKELRKSVYDASSYEWIRIRDIADYIACETGATVSYGSQKGHDPKPAANMGRVPGWLPEREIRESIRLMIEQAEQLLRHESI